MFEHEYPQWEFIEVLSWKMFAVFPENGVYVHECSVNGTYINICLVLYHSYLHTHTQSRLVYTTKRGGRDWISSDFQGQVSVPLRLERTVKRQSCYTYAVADDWGHLQRGQKGSQMLTCLRAQGPVRWCHVRITWNKEEVLVEVRVKSAGRSMCVLPGT